MRENYAHEDYVDDAVCGLPFAVAGYHDERDEHQGGAVVDGAEAADESFW